jgi:tRNA A37 threonylcarbamoyladenosine biosynthesis protein TsaE
MFQLPIPEDQTADGSTEYQPLRLVGIQKTDFQRLLKVILRLDAATGSPETKNWEEWESVLKLATMWHFDFIRSQSIKTLSSMELDPVDKIILGRKYYVSEWMASALNDLAKRDAALNLDDFNRLFPITGPDFILKIAQVRESLNVTTGTTRHKEKCSSCSRNLTQLYCSNCGNYTNCSPSTSTSTFTTRASHDFSSLIKSTFDL